HHLDQDRELQLAAAHHFEGVVTELLDADGNVGEQLFIEPLAQIARRDPLSFAAGERRSVDGEGHRNGRFVDLDVRQRGGRLGAGDGFADGYAFQAADVEYITEPAGRLIHALH